MEGASGLRAGVDGRERCRRILTGFKRLFGEVVSATRFERMVKEIELKVWVYNLMLGLALAPAFSAAGSWQAGREGRQGYHEAGSQGCKLLNKTWHVLVLTGLN